MGDLMGERIQIEYRPLFKVVIRHLYFLNQGATEFEHMTAENRQAVLRSYDTRDHFDIRPTRDTLRILKRHRLVFKTEAMGFSVYAPVTAAKLDFPSQLGTRLRFFATARNRSFDDISNFGSAQQPVRSVHVFSTMANNVDAEGQHLTRTLNGFSSSRTYPAGAQIVNNRNDVTRRLTAVRSVNAGSARQSGDWIETIDLPKKLTTQLANGLAAGELARKDGVVFEALVNRPGINVGDSSKWKMLLTPGIQAASDADRTPISGRFVNIDLENNTLTFIAVEIQDRAGSVVYSEQLRGSVKNPVSRVSVDMSNQVAGFYRIFLKDNAGALLQHNGNDLPQADQSFYFDEEALQKPVFGIFEIGTAAGDYRLVDNNGDVLSPEFLLRIANRATFWSYTFPQPLTATEQAKLTQSVDLQAMANAPDRIISQRALGLSRGLVVLKRPGTDTLLPNPTLQTGFAIESATGRLISNINLSHKT